MEEPKNILIRMPNWLGDLVMATPLLTDIKTKWPQAKLTAMCQGNVGTLLQNDPHVDEIYNYRRPSGWIHRKQHLAIIDHLKRGNYDLGILTTNSFSSAWWFWKGSVQQKVGFKGNLRSWLLDVALPFPKNKESQHLVLTYKKLLEPLGVELSKTPPQLYVNPTEREQATKLLSNYGFQKGEGSLIGINPGAAYGSAKCWLPERFREVTKRLLERPNVTIVYFGDPAGTPLVNAICKEMPNRVINLASKTSIRELIALIQQCDVFLTNDSGPMHIAAALGTPLLALFGSTNEVKTGPYPQGDVIHKHVECSPCYKRVCPIDFRCMTRITSDEVYERLVDILSK